MQKNHVIKGKSLDVKKALSKVEMDRVNSQRGPDSGPPNGGGYRGNSGPMGNNGGGGGGRNYQRNDYGNNQGGGGGGGGWNNNHRNNGGGGGGNDWNNGGGECFTWKLPNINIQFCVLCVPIIVVDEAARPKTAGNVPWDKTHFKFVLNSLNQKRMECKRGWTVLFYCFFIFWFRLRRW